MLASLLENRLQAHKITLSDAYLVHSFQAGGDWAATSLHERYERRVRGLVQQNWPVSMQSRCDPEDIVQEVFTRFFRAVQRGIYSASEETNLWGFLLVVTLNQVRKTTAQHHSERRDVRQTVGEAEWREDVASARTEGAAHSRLVVDELLDSLPFPMRRAVERRLEGFTVTEISHDLMISQRAAERLLQSVRQRVGQFFDRASLPDASALLRLRKGPTKPVRPLSQPHDEQKKIKIA
jgi:RNA polymerase sigma-70 factor, ECF subfamily